MNPPVCPDTGAVNVCIFYPDPPPPTLPDLILPWLLVVIGALILVGLLAGIITTARARKTTT